MAMLLPGSRGSSWPSLFYSINHDFYRCTCQGLSEKFGWSIWIWLTFAVRITSFSHISASETHREVNLVSITYVFRVKESKKTTNSDFDTVGEAILNFKMATKIFKVGHLTKVVNLKPPNWFDDFSGGHSFSIKDKPGRFLAVGGDQKLEQSINLSS